MPQNEQSRGLSGLNSTDSSHSNALKGKSYLLGIGIDDYQNFLPLKNAVKDVQDISNLLVDKYEFEQANVTLLINEEATRKNIIKQLKALCTKAKVNDRILIYYSGHGYLDKVTDRGFWIPVDAEKEDESSYVSNANLRDYVKAMKSRHTLLISDSCFSGSLLVRDATRKLSGAFDTWEKSKSRYVFSSGKGIVSDGEAGKNSPFAKAIIKKLSNPSSSKINIVRLADEVTHSVRWNYEQQPNASVLQFAGHDGGQFVFHLKNDEITDWKAVDKREREVISPIHSYTPSYIKLLPLLFVILFGIWLFSIRSNDIILSTGSLIDSRDKNIYIWAQLKDGKKWMTQNLKYKTVDSWCYDDDSANCKKYGRLYTWEAAQKACPIGWRLPSDDEWWDMTSKYGKAYSVSKGNEGDDAGKTAYKALMPSGRTFFSAQLGGRRFDDNCFGLDEYAYYWSSTEFDVNYAWYYYLHLPSEYLRRRRYYNSSGFSCRCIKD